MNKIAIIGAGGFGREVKTLIDDINKYQKSFELIGFFDDDIEKGNIVNGLEVLGNLKSLNEIDYNLSLALGVGTPIVKQKIIDKLSNKYIDFPNLIHHSVVISNDDVKMGKGNIICAGCIITCNINLEDFITFNLACTIGHDTKINSYSSFMPSVNVSGEVTIDEKVYVGTGAKIINQLSIGKNTIVGAGAVVSKSLPENCTAVGVPAKPIKYH